MTTDSPDPQPRKRTTREELLSALNGPPEATKVLDKAQLDRLARLQPLAQRAQEAVEHAAEQITALLEEARDMLEPVTYGHGDPKDPDADPANPKHVATEGDEASSENLLFAHTVLHALGPVIVRQDETAAAARNTFNRLGLWTAVSSLRYGHISKVAAALRRSPQQLRRLIEHKDNYPRFLETTAPGHTNRWGHRGMKSPAYLRRLGRGDDTGHIPVVDPADGETTADGVDMVAVERAVNGTVDPATLTTAEKDRAFRIMQEHKIPVQVMAERLGTDPQQIEQWKKSKGTRRDGTEDPAA